MDDLISRQAAIERITDPSINRIEQALNEVPNIRSKQKTGQWLINSDGYYPYCSICKNEPQGRIMTDYWPNCGAKMESDNNDS